MVKNSLLNAFQICSHIESKELCLLKEALSDVIKKIPNFEKVLTSLLISKGYTIEIYRIPLHGGVDSAVTVIHPNSIHLYLYNIMFNGCDYRFENLKYYAKGTFVHEIAHVIDILMDLKLSNIFYNNSESYYFENVESIKYQPMVGEEEGGTTKCGEDDHFDDYAESFATFIYGENYDNNQGKLVSKDRLELIKVIYIDYLSK